MGTEFHSGWDDEIFLKMGKWWWLHNNVNA